MQSKKFKAWALGTTLMTVFGAATVPLTGAVAVAQDYTTGALDIVVVNQDGNAIPGAAVSLVSQQTGYTRELTTRPDGQIYVGRLPIGRYTVSLRAEGYQPATDDAVQVNVGGNTEFTFRLQPGTLQQDVIVVTGSAVTGGSFAAAETGINIDVDETFEQIPLPRGINALTQLAPGTVAGDSAFGGTSISGSSAAENAFYINGMNITDFRNFLGASTVPFEFYQQVQVKSGGYQAEFGRSTGGVINAVTKSGSNEWGGGFSVYYSPDELREDSPNTQFSLNEFDQRTSTEYNAWISGPLIEDRLFFYGLYTPQRSESINIGTSGRQTTDVRDDPFYGYKLDAILFQGHTLEWTGFSDERVTVRTSDDVTFNADNEIVSSTPVGTTNFFAGGDVNILKYTGSFTDWLTVSVLAGRQSFDQTTAGEQDDCPVVYDTRDPLNPQNLGCWSGFTVAQGQDERELFRADADIYVNDFFGEHQIRVGVDREDLSAFDQTSYSGGIYYRYYDPVSCENQGGIPGEECVRVRVFEGGGEFETIQTAFYIQDSWQVTDQLLLNLGVRNETFDNRNANGETFTEIEDQIAPRFSALYDVRGDGTLDVFGSYGRYFLPVATNTNIRLAGAELFTQDWYQFSSINSDDTPDLAGPAFQMDVFGDGTVPDTRSVVNPDLEPMFKDEYILGVRWLPRDNLEVEATYTYRSLEQTLEDIAVDAAVNAYCVEQGIVGCDSIWTGFHSYVLTNPGVGFTFQTDELPGSTGFVDIPLSAENLGYPEASNVYEALQLSFNYVEDRWNLRGSWTISRSEGNYEGPVKSDNGQDDAGITTSFDQPGLTDGSDGLLPNHRAHKIKLFGSYLVTEQLRVGGNLQITSPRHFGCIGVHPTDVFAGAYGAESWYCGGELTPRASQLESDWVYDLDFNLVYEIGTIEFGRAIARVDVFNLLNADAATDLYEAGETDGGAPLSYYGNASGYQAPRSVRFGLSWEF